jgi:hypothetical protein
MARVGDASVRSTTWRRSRKASSARRSVISTFSAAIVAMSARLLAIQELGRGFPLADRDVADGRDDRGGATIARSASAETLADGDSTRAATPLPREVADHRLGRVIVALADVLIADDAFAIDQDRRRPGPDAPALPDREVVVLHDGISDTELLRGIDDARVGLLPQKSGLCTPTIVKPSFS